MKKNDANTNPLVSINSNLNSNTINTGAITTINSLNKLLINQGEAVLAFPMVIHGNRGAKTIDFYFDHENGKTLYHQRILR